MLLGAGVGGLVSFRVGSLSEDHAQEGSFQRKQVWAEEMQGGEELLPPQDRDPLGAGWRLAHLRVQ